MSDLISRQAAIDALDNLDYMPGEWSVRGLSLCKDAIKALPPAQPEEDCKNCKHGGLKDSRCDNCRVGCMNYPSYYERKTYG